MKLKKLLKDLPVEVKGPKDIEVTGVCSDSRRVYPGNLFIAKKGARYDGAQFIFQAVQNGAIAVVSDFFDPFLKKTQILTSTLSAVESRLIARFYDFPSKELFLVGITGTNGKTTTAYLVKYLLDQTSSLCGLVSTNEYIIGSHHLPPLLTTPPNDMNQKMLREMCSVGCTSAVIEVSSHALEQNRIDFLDFDVAIFSNLSQEHLDYHQTMKNYAMAKRKLFGILDQSMKKDKLAIYNMDDPWHTKIIEGIESRKFSYGIQRDADLVASDIKFSTEKTSLNVCYNHKKVSFEIPLLGKINVYNLLATLSLGLHRKIELEKMRDILRNFPPVKGRLQKIGSSKKTVYVDFAHTPEALKRALTILNDLKEGKLFLVFGCGGNRDKEKRAKMGKIAEELSDFFIVTNDNPRNENPEEIVRQILSQVNKSDKYMIELDRKEAIRKSIEKSKTNDIILVAGKGHETKQIFSHRTIDFDDVKVVEQILNS